MAGFVEVGPFAAASRKLLYFHDPVPVCWHGILASFGAHQWVGYAAFHRKAVSLEGAICAAIAHVGAVDLTVMKVGLSTPFLESVGC